MITDYGSDALIELVSLSGACDYITILTSIPYGSIDGSDLTGFEPTWEGYSREYISSWSTSTGGLVYNNDSVSFYVPPDPEDYDNEDDVIVGWGLCDSSSGGHIYLMGEFIEPIPTFEDSTILILPGMISIGISTTQAGDDD